MLFSRRSIPSFSSHISPNPLVVPRFANRLFSSSATSVDASSKSHQSKTSDAKDSLIICHNSGRWPTDLLAKIRDGTKDAKMFENFVSHEEEQQFIKDTHQQLRRLRYEEEHWDDAIRKYREIEKTDWSPLCQAAVQRVRALAFPSNDRLISSVHVLDLAADGYIKPHIDSERYCGDTIAGLSLLTDSVMRLVHKDQKDIMFDLYLKRLSLYILTGTARYDFTHEVLPETDSYFNGVRVSRGRRIAVICRAQPKSIKGIYDDGKPI